MRLQFSLRTLLCVMLVLALLSVWQRDRAANVVSAIAAACRVSGQPQHDDDEARPAPLDEVQLAVREFLIEEGKYYAARASAEAAMNRAEFLFRYIETHRDDPAAMRVALEALRALRLDSPPPRAGQRHAFNRRARPRRSLIRWAGGTGGTEESG
jgi:hypothetical protein